MGRNSDRERLFERQAHAFAHLLDVEPSFPVALCPLCLGPFGSGDVHGCAEHQPNVAIEHSPPRQRTRFGAPRGACLTHVSCQGSITYESAAGRYRSDLDRLRRGEESVLQGLIDGRDALVRLQVQGGVVQPVRVPAGTTVVGVPLTLPVAAQLTELKAAYLIAFTVLGYTWAASPALDEVRAAIQSGDASALGSIPLFKTSDPIAELANTVLVSDGADRLAVVGDDPNWGVLLPLRAPFTVGSSDRSLFMQADAIPWLPDNWWRRSDASAFQWDCRNAAPRWRIDLEEPQ
jgi:hypothetical protein